MKEQVIVLGLGRFGSALARELERLGHEVLAADHHAARVNEVSPDVTRAVELDATDETALRAIGAGDFSIGFVAMSDPEPSIFATTTLKRLGVATVVARAQSALHAEILGRVGADRVVFPEQELGLQIARTAGAKHAIEYLEVASGVGLEKVRVSSRMAGQALRQVFSVGRNSLRLVALIRGREVTVNPPMESQLAEGDLLLVLGPDAELASVGR